VKIAFLLAALCAAQNSFAMDGVRDLPKDPSLELDFLKHVPDEAKLETPEKGNRALRAPRILGRQSVIGDRPTEFDSDYDNYQNRVDCFNDAYSNTPLNREQSLRLCRSAVSNAPVNCMREAYRKTVLNYEESVNICTGTKEHSDFSFSGGYYYFAAACYSYVYRNTPTGFGRELTIRVCSGLNRDSIVSIKNCVVNLYTSIAPLTRSGSAVLCARVENQEDTLRRRDCYNRAYAETPLNAEESADLCGASLPQ
jgi:hypothetical protein